MQITLPNPDTHAAAFLVSNVKPAGGAALTRELGTVLVKAAYDLVPGTVGIHEMVLAPAPARNAIRFADQTGTYDIDGNLTAFTYTGDADIAPQKRNVDLIVEGFASGTGTGLIRIDGTDWFRRISPADPDPNLFGWEPPDSEHRRLSDNGDPGGNDAWIAGYGPFFHNGHRRGNGFTYLRPGANIASGQLVEIFRTSDASDTPFRINLPDLSLPARYRFHSGQCPDMPNRWAFQHLPDLRADTLIINPSLLQATILWRGGWTFTVHPADQYRRIELLKEVA